MSNSACHHWQGTSGVCEDELDIWIAVQCASDQEIDDRAGRVLRNLGHERRNVRQQILTTSWCGRMSKDDCAAPVDLVEYVRVGRVPQPSIVIAGKNPQALSAQNIARIFDFAQASLNVRERNGRKSAEAAWISPGQIGAIFIAAPGGVTRALRVAEPDAGRGQRDDGKLYAAPVHLLKRLLGRPFEPGGTDESATRRRNPVAVFAQIEWRHNVMMEVDQATVGALCRVYCHVR